MGGLCWCCHGLLRKALCFLGTWSMLGLSKKCGGEQQGDAVGAALCLMWVYRWAYRESRVGRLRSAVGDVWICNLLGAFRVGTGNFHLAQIKWQFPQAAQEEEATRGVLFVSSQAGALWGLVLAQLWCWQPSLSSTMVMQEEQWYKEVAIFFLLLTTRNRCMIFCSL